MVYLWNMKHANNKLAIIVDQFFYIFSVLAHSQRKKKSQKVLFCWTLFKVGTWSNIQHKTWRTFKTEVTQITYKNKACKHTWFTNTLHKKAYVVFCRLEVTRTTLFYALFIMTYNVQQNKTFWLFFLRWLCANFIVKYFFFYIKGFCR
jgi:hypothetical protein